MSERDFTIRMTTEPFSFMANVQRYDDPEKTLEQRLITNVVRSLILPSSEVIEDAGSASYFFSPELGHVVEESITLDAQRAKRLVSVFRELAVHHSLECHDLIDRVYGQRHAAPSTLKLADSVKSVESVEPGVPYVVRAVYCNTDSYALNTSHSCIGTNENRLLGIVGRGWPMATMDGDHTREFYANGSPISYLVRA